MLRGAEPKRWLANRTEQLRGRASQPGWFGYRLPILQQNDRSQSAHTPAFPAEAADGHQANRERVRIQHCTRLPQGRHELSYALRALPADRVRLKATFLPDQAGEEI